MWWVSNNKCYKNHRLYWWAQNALLTKILTYKSDNISYQLQSEKEMEVKISLKYKGKVNKYVEINLAPLRTRNKQMLGRSTEKNL